jgi:predicted TIM-barrel fold metal-dependent hydrolase
MNNKFEEPQNNRHTTIGQRLFRGCACCQIANAPADPARRTFLAGGLAALGLGASANAPAKSRAAVTRRIDVHHHYIPPVHAEAMAAIRVGGPPPPWSPQLSFADMEKSGSTMAVLSLVQPGVWLGDVRQARRLARACNDYGARLRMDYPGRFGLFAAIPLPDTEGSLGEIEYALDVLKADGIGLFTSYEGKYLGDPAFIPVFDELNRRKAVVYTHPSVPACCTSMIKGVSTSTIEYATDTTRTIASLIFGAGGTAFRCPDIRFIWSHSGGTLPFLISRFIREQDVKKDPRMPVGPVPIVQKYFYEIAQGNMPGQLAALLKLIPVSQLMFGSDYPFRQGVEAADGLAAYNFSESDRAAIDWKTAIGLMPNLS